MRRIFYRISHKFRCLIFHKQKKKGWQSFSHHYHVFDLKSDPKPFWLDYLTTRDFHIFWPILHSQIPKNLFSKPADTKVSSRPFPSLPLLFPLFLTRMGLAFRWVQETKYSRFKQHFHTSPKLLDRLCRQYFSQGIYVATRNFDILVSTPAFPANTCIF